MQDIKCIVAHGTVSYRPFLIDATISVSPFAHYKFRIYQACATLPFAALHLLLFCRVFLSKMLWRMYRRSYVHARPVGPLWCPCTFGKLQRAYGSPFSVCVTRASPSDCKRCSKRLRDARCARGVTRLCVTRVVYYRQRASGNILPQLSMLSLSGHPTCAIGGVVLSP